MGFDVGELSVPFHSALPSETTPGHTSRGEGRLRFGHVIHKAQATSDAIDHLLSSGCTEDRSSEAVAATVGQPNRMLVILNAEELEDRAEELLIPSLIGAFDDSDREEWFGHFVALPGDFVGLRHGFELIGEGIMQVLPG